MGKPIHIYKSYILSTIEEVWDAIVNPDKTVHYFYGTRVQSDWEVGSPLDYYYPDGRQASTGEILAIDAPKRIEFTFHALWDDELKAEGPAREVWALAEINGMVELMQRREHSSQSTKTISLETLQILGEAYRIAPQPTC